MGPERVVGDALVGLARALVPLAEALDSPEELDWFLGNFGWRADHAAFAAISGQIGNLPEDLVSLGRAAERLASLPLDADTAVVVPLITAVGAEVANVTNDLRLLQAAPPPSGLPPPFDEPALWATLGEEAIGFLVYRHLERQRPTLLGNLRALGIASTAPAPTTQTRGARIERTIDWTRVVTTAANPGGLFGDVYAWGGVFDHERFIDNLLALATGLGSPAMPELPSSVLLDDYYDAASQFLRTIAQLRVPVAWGFADDNGVMQFYDFSLLVLPIPPADDRMAAPTGFVVAPDVTGNLGVRTELSTDIHLELTDSLVSAGSFRIEIRPTGTRVVVSPTSGELIAASAKLTAQPATPWLLLGARESTRLELAATHAELTVHGPTTSIDAGFAVIADNARVVIDFNDGDGFLRSMLGGGPKSFDFEFRLRWSGRNGFSFDAHGALGVEIPVHQSIAGVIDVSSVYVRISADNQRVGLVLAATGSLNLGPCRATVMRVGLRADARPIPRGVPPGNLGDLDLAFAFKPPDGLGLVIDAGAITGGGFISFDETRERYTGALELQVYGIGVKAIGLLETRLPGGASGFALLILFSPEFAPVQLGFGFTLNGVGGLAGINHTVDVDAIQGGMRKKTLDQTLFPPDPVGNAGQIISDLENLFPTRPGRYVFGPIGLIGWGTPTLIEAEIAVILELPDPVRLILLGQMQSALPSRDVAIIELHVDVFGVLDAGAKLLAIDASLHDSRLVAFSLYGDMALRVSWGDPPSFALSVGGFNPHFRPPTRFPTLNRLTVDLGTGDNPRIRFQAYLAVTSNTFQFGASAELYAEAGGFNIYGWISFDALFIFDPFSFVTDFSAGVALRIGSSTIAGIHLSAKLAGPTPWHAWGEACLSILFFDICVDFDATIGERRQIPLQHSDLWPLLRKAIEDARNWSGSWPAGALPVVTTKPTPMASNAAPVDPVGQLTLREKVLPLNRRLTRFGETELDGPGIYTIADDGVSPPGEWSFVRDYFAPAQFEDLTDDQKLSRPSFERMDAGLTLKGRPAAHGPALESDLVYETVMIDAAGQSQRGDPYPPTLEHQLATLAIGAVARSSLLNTGLGKFAPDPRAPVLVGLEEETFVVASTSTLKERADITAPGTKGAINQALHEYLSANPGERTDLQVIPLSQRAA